MIPEYIGIMKEMAETPIKSGARVGNYILKKEIGKGAFSHVWKAVHHERPNSVVAVKTATEPGFRRQLSREGHLPEIDHPNVVPILDSDTRFAETPYIVMPYLTGGSLRELIAEYPNGLPEERVEALLDDILAGLAAAHSQGIIHRDIKPSNILLDEDGRAMLSDFGLSLNNAGPDGVRSVIQSASLSQEQSNIAGTIAYMAPEVREGETATAASDIYSVGVLIFEMLTGRRPSGLEMPGDATSCLRRKAAWDTLYYGASRPPKDRYSDAAAMLEALGRGAAPTPFDRENPPVARPVQVDLAESGSLQNDLWEVLEVRWEERGSARRASIEQGAKIEEALGMYLQDHPTVVSLRTEGEAIDAHLKDTQDRLNEVCQRIATHIGQQSSFLKQERAKLLETGYLKSNPDVKDIDSRIDLYTRLQTRVRFLSSADEEHPLIIQMRAFRSAHKSDTPTAYKHFLTIHGDGPSNPWATQAKTLLIRAIRIERKEAIRLERMSSAWLLGAFVRENGPWLLFVFIAIVMLVAFFCFSVATTGYSR